MQKLIWTFIVINWLASALFFFSAILIGLPKENQAKVYLFAIIILLFIAGFAAYLWRFNHPYWALAISGLPATTFLLVSLLYKY